MTDVKRSLLALKYLSRYGGDPIEHLSVIAGAKFADLETKDVEILLKYFFDEDKSIVLAVIDVFIKFNSVEALKHLLNNRSIIAIKCLFMETESSIVANKILMLTRQMMTVPIGITKLLSHRYHIVFLKKFEESLAMIPKIDDFHSNMLIDNVMDLLRLLNKMFSANERKQELIDGGLLRAHYKLIICCSSDKRFTKVFILQILQFLTDILKRSDNLSIPATSCDSQIFEALMKCLNLDSLVVVECMLNVSCRMNIRPTLYFTKAIEWLINQLESHVNTNGGVNNPDWPKVHLKAFHLISTHYGNIDLIISKGGYRILLELCKSRVCHHQVYLAIECLKNLLKFDQHLTEISNLNFVSIISEIIENCLIEMEAHVTPHVCFPDLNILSNAIQPSTNQDRAAKRCRKIINECLSVLLVLSKRNCTQVHNKSTVMLVLKCLKNVGSIDDFLILSSLFKKINTIRFLLNSYCTKMTESSILNWLQIIRFIVANQMFLNLNLLESIGYNYFYSNRLCTKCVQCNFLHISCSAALKDYQKCLLSNGSDNFLKYLSSNVSQSEEKNVPMILAYAIELPRYLKYYIRSGSLDQVINEIFGDNSRSSLIALTYIATIISQDAKFKVKTKPVIPAPAPAPLRSNQDEANRESNQSEDKNDDVIIMCEDNLKIVTSKQVLMRQLDYFKAMYSSVFCRKTDNVRSYQSHKVTTSFLDFVDKCNGPVTSAMKEVFKDYKLDVKEALDMFTLADYWNAKMVLDSLLILIPKYVLSAKTFYDFYKLLLTGHCDYFRHDIMAIFLGNNVLIDKKLAICKDISKASRQSALSCDIKSFFNAFIDQ